MVANVITLLAALFFAKRYFSSVYTQRTFSRLIDHTNTGYYRYRAKDGVILAANKAFVDILELDADPKDIIGRSLTELLIYIDSEGSIRKKLKERGELRNYEYRFKTLSGSDKTVLHNSYIVKGGPGPGEIIEALIQDITEERLSYEKMKESQERYEKLFMYSGDMVMIFRLDDLKIEQVNPVTEVSTGFSQKELIERSIEDLIHPSRRDGLKECHDDLLFKGVSSLETVIVCKNGTYKEVIMTCSLVEIKDHRIVMALIKDVSAMVRGREEQRRRQKEMEDFWKASVEREGRIKDLKTELDRTKQQIKLLKHKNESSKPEDTE